MMYKQEWLPAEQRVVVTGMGAITPNGLDMPTTWRKVRDGCSGIGRITLFDTSAFRVHIAGEAWGFDARDYMTVKEARRADRNVQFAIAACIEALQQADLAIGPDNADDIGVYVGSSAGGIWTYTQQQAILNAQGPRALSPLLIPMIVVDSAAVQIGIRWGVHGPNLGMASACASGLDAMGLALETIRRGDAKVMITGGTDAVVNELGIGGLDRLGALSHRNDDPAGASRPFDASRDGFVLGEGGVVMILESLAYARERGAMPLAEIRSYAATSEGMNFVAPDASGSGAIRCMTRALEKAHLSPKAVDYINAHATGTPVGDPIEVTAIRAILGEHWERVAVSSTKSTTGHLLGAAGALAAALTITAMREGCIPPTINLSNPDVECDVRHVANVAEQTEAEVALVANYGFGGHDSCVVISKWDAA